MLFEVPADAAYETLIPRAKFWNFGDAGVIDLNWVDKDWSARD
jgi:hypothetical protein